MPGCGAQHLPVHLQSSCRCGSEEGLVVAAECCRTSWGVLLVKVGDIVSVLSLDITDVSVAARSKVGVETYQRLGATVLEVEYTDVGSV